MTDRPEREPRVIAGGLLFIAVGIWAMTKGDALGIILGLVFLACGAFPFVVLLLRR